MMQQPMQSPGQSTEEAVRAYLQQLSGWLVDCSGLAGRHATKPGTDRPWKHQSRKPGCRLRSGELIARCETIAQGGQVILVKLADDAAELVVIIIGVGSMS